MIRFTEEADTSLGSRERARIVGGHFFTSSFLQQGHLTIRRRINRKPKTSQEDPTKDEVSHSLYPRRFGRGIYVPRDTQFDAEPDQQHGPSLVCTRGAHGID